MALSGDRVALGRWLDLMLSKVFPSPGDSVPLGLWASVAL